MPYLAGLYALACKIRPDITPEGFWAAAIETGVPLDSTSQGSGSLAVVVDPVELMETLQDGR